MTNTPIYQLLRACLAPRLRLLGKITGVVVILNITELSIPKLLQLFIDSLLEKPLTVLIWEFPDLDKGFIYWLPALLAGVGVIRWGVSYFAIYLQARLGQEALHDVRSQVYHAIQRQSFRFHDNTHSGNLISNIVEDLRYLNQFLITGFFPIFESIAYMIFLHAFLIYISWPIGLAATLLFGGAVCLAFLHLRFRFSILIESKVLFSEMVEHFTENMEGYLVTHAFGLDGVQQGRHFGKIARLHKKLRQESLFLISVHHIMVFAATLSVPVSIGVAVYLIQHQWDISMGTLFMIGFLQLSLITKTRMFGRACITMAHCIVTAERLTKLFDSQEILKDSAHQYTIDDTSYECRQVGFTYANAPSLRDISFKISANQIVAIIGITGSGKSTLAHLLARFYDADSGQIFLGQHPIAHYPLQELREKVAIVFQESFLFSGSIHDNIAFGKPDATHEQVVAMAKIAQAHEFIMAMPNGYETIIGERGISLSGGQKQRVSIARALLKQPQILILDDATSALDAQTEAAIVDNLAVYLGNITTFIIAHRESSIARANYVLLMEEGTIAKQGPPEMFFGHQQTLHNVLMESVEKNAI